MEVGGRQIRFELGEVDVFKTLDSLEFHHDLVADDEIQPLHADVDAFEQDMDLFLSRNGIPRCARATSMAF